MFNARIKELIDYCCWDPSFPAMDWIGMQWIVSKERLRFGACIHKLHPSISTFVFKKKLSVHYPEHQDVPIRKSFQAVRNI